MKQRHPARDPGESRAGCVPDGRRHRLRLRQPAGTRAKPGMISAAPAVAAVVAAPPRSAAPARPRIQLREPKRFETYRQLIVFVSRESAVRFVALLFPGRVTGALYARAHATSLSPLIGRCRVSVRCPQWGAATSNDLAGDAASEILLVVMETEHFVVNTMRAPHPRGGVRDASGFTIDPQRLRVVSHRDLECRSERAGRRFRGAREPRDLRALPGDPAPRARDFASPLRARRRMRRAVTRDSRSDRRRKSRRRIVLHAERLLPRAERRHPASRTSGSSTPRPQAFGIPSLP